MAAALLLIMSTEAAATEIVFRVDQAVNLDMDAAQLAERLAAKEVDVRITYAPLLAIPGWTGRFGLCSGPSICLKKRWRSRHLSGEKIIRQPQQLQFPVRGWQWFGLMPYRPAGPLRVSLPPFWPGDLPVNIDSDLAVIPSAEENRQSHAQSIKGYPVMELHLPPPYAGVASWHRASGTGTGTGTTTAASAATAKAAVDSCDPALTLQADGSPRLRPHRESEAYVAWLQALADSPWWAEQIDGVTLSASPVSADEKRNPELSWRRVAVERGGVQLRYLRVQHEKLRSSQCPGRTRYEFSWRNGELLAASLQETPDPFTEMPGCDGNTGVRGEEALWWQGQLQRRAFSGLLPGQQQLRETWREDSAQCALGPEQGPLQEPVLLRQLAEEWSFLTNVK
ncbi:MAG: hypothetical protein Q8J78_14740 [Moraxellaceae bacterium]|nr:hypothetical protein [Moraxellaceae bacterium]